MQYESLWVIFLSMLLAVSCSKNTADLDIEQPKRTEMLAFKNVNLVPMTEEGVIDNQTVLVDETKIIEIYIKKFSLS